MESSESRPLRLQDKTQVYKDIEHNMLVVHRGTISSRDGLKCLIYHGGMNNTVYIKCKILVGI